MSHLHLKTAAALFSLALLAGFGPANATSLLTLNAPASLTVPVVHGGGGGFDHSGAAQYRPNYGSNYGPANQNYGTERYGRPYAGGGDEVRELQRAFPFTSWPPSMRNED
jgi:hypothetical protein